jgi:murein DD-endopeptidase MepM/ murein hydrolase activator NlpD
MPFLTRWFVASAAALGTAAATPTLALAHSATSETIAAVELSACPVVGASDYVDSWGDPRSGGRRHEGVDMVATRGTPVTAVVDGEAEFKRSNLGGNAIWLVAANGQRFYYAHLDAFHGASRTVQAGDIIGYVGSTGNAKGSHLHFETRLGDVAVNPYPAVHTACANIATDATTNDDAPPAFRSPRDPR